MRLARAVVGDQLTGLHPGGQRLQAARADVGTLPTLGQRPVEEHRQLELVADQRGRGERRRDRGAPRGGVEVDDRCDVDRADVRVEPLVPGDVDRGDCRRAPARSPSAMSACSPAKREDRPAVVGIGVDVEQAQRPERGRQPLDRRAVTALADVRDRQEHGLSLPHLGWVAQLVRAHDS